MANLNFEIEGVCPMIMHADTLCDPLHPLAKEMKVITSKRKKTDEDHEALALLEFRAGIYHDPEIGPYVPGANVAACIRDAGKMSKLGKAIVQASHIAEHKIPLEYDGPREMAKLEQDRRFWYRRSVVIQRSRTIRTRPIFEQWQLKFTLAFDASILNPDTLKEVAETAGAMIGLVDNRPLFGRFRVLNERG